MLNPQGVKVIAVTVSQTTALIVALTGLIAAIGSVIAAVLGTLNRRALTTPSGRSIGKQVESALHTGIANNMQLAAMNGPSKPATPEQLSAESATPPAVPVES